MNNRTLWLLGLVFMAAVSGSTQAAEEAREDPRLVLNRGVALARHGRWSKALPLLRSAAHRAPALAAAHHDLGAVLAQQGSHEEAVGSFRRALELEDAAETHEALGLTLLYLGRNQEALVEYDEARQRGSSSAATLFNRGLALERIGRRADAEEAYREALARDASFAPARDAMVRLSRRAERRATAP